MQRSMARKPMIVSCSVSYEVDSAEPSLGLAASSANSRSGGVPSLDLAERIAAVPFVRRLFVRSAADTVALRLRGQRNFTRVGESSSISA